MEVKVIGGHGGVAQGMGATSFLIDGVLLIDCGSVATSLSMDEQIKIEHVLLSHSHLDHIKDLAFLCDNCFGMKEYRPFEIYSSSETKQSIMDHLFNDHIWPDFTKIPQPVKGRPVVRFNQIESEKSFRILDYDITPVRVTHQVDTLGFIIESKGASVLFTLDTMATERIWEVARDYKNIKAIFTEISFPNHLQKIADASFHHTPQSLKREIPKMPENVPIYIGHLKPNFHKDLIHQINSLNEPRIQILDVDGRNFEFF